MMSISYYYETKVKKITTDYTDYTDFCFYGEASAEGPRNAQPASHTIFLATDIGCHPFPMTNATRG